MSELDGRVIAIAGVAGGLGPVVAERLAEAGATVAGTDVSQEQVDAVGDGARAARAERWDGRAVDLLDEDGDARTGARRCSSASAGSTASCTWSAAGAAGSRCTRSRSPTGTSCTIC